MVAKRITLKNSSLLTILEVTWIYACDKCTDKIYTQTHTQMSACETSEIWIRRTVSVSVFLVVILCLERLRAGGEGDNRGWDSWMASPTHWTWVWVDSRSWWWTGRPGVLRFMGSKESDMTERLNWNYSYVKCYHWRNWVKDILCIISYNYMWI